MNVEKLKIEKLNTENLVINEQILIVNKNKFFNGKVVKIQENCFLVSIAINQLNYKPVNLGEEMKFMIAHKSEAFSCKSKVLGCKILDKCEIVLLDLPVVLNRIERREYPRVAKCVELEYRYLSNSFEYKTVKDIPTIVHGKLKKSFSLDISGNGIKMITYEEAKDFKNAHLRLYIGEEIDILCSVVRSEYDKINKHYKTAFHFEDLDNLKWHRLNEYIYG